MPLGGVGTTLLGGRVKTLGRGRAKSPRGRNLGSSGVWEIPAQSLQSPKRGGDRDFGGQKRGLKTGKGSGGEIPNWEGVGGAPKPGRRTQNREGCWRGQKGSHKSGEGD